MKTQKKSQSCFEESGYVVVLISLSMIVLLAFVAFVVDLGNALRIQRTLQYGTDAASLAAVLLFSEASHTDSEVSTDVSQTLGDNGFNSLNSLSSSCGVWDDATDTFSLCGGGGAPCTDCSDASANAVQVAASASMSTAFARLVGVNTLFPAVISIAFIDSLALSNCIRPFSIEFDQVDGVKNIGDFIDVGNNAPANWGKIDLGINASSGKSFEEAMLTDQCEEEFEIGNTVSPGTGFGGPIRNVFDQIIDQGKQDMTIGLVSPFPNGNSADVTLLEFARVRFHNDNGRNGNNWIGTFEILERDVDPPNGGQSGLQAGARVLVQ